MLIPLGTKKIKQSSGGPIGPRATYAIAWILMIYWDKKFMEKLGQLRITWEVLVRFVDDIQIIVQALRLVESLDEKGVLKWDKEWYKVILGMVSKQLM